MAKIITTQNVGNALALIGPIGLPVLFAVAIYQATKVDKIYGPRKV